MPAKRRRTIDRNPLHRLEMWDKKMNPSVYAINLQAVKPIAMPKVSSYQYIHESLISTVKNILSNYPNEAAILQEYMWYAEKLWKLTKQYTSQALQTQADALYLWYVARGRSDIALRLIAKTLGINISPAEQIIDRVLSPILHRIIGKGTLTADGSEQTLIEYTGDISLISGYVDLTNMESEDTVIIKSYVKLKEDGEYRLYRSETFQGHPVEPAVYVLPRLSGYGIKLTIQQTTGTYKNYDYLFVRGT